MRAGIRAVTTAVMAITLGAGSAAAQEVQPGVATMRYFACGLADLDDAVEILNGTWREVADELVEEGLLLGYGILTHAWGDEWNLVDYYTAADAPAFQAAWAELILRYQARDRDGSQFERFGQLCPRHKDNQYAVVPPR